MKPKLYFSAKNNLYLDQITKKKIFLFHKLALKVDYGCKKDLGNITFQFGYVINNEYSPLLYGNG